VDHLDRQVLGAVSADLVAAAAMNNAVWCDAVCRAHGLATEFAEHAWVSREQAPTLYPNLVTLSANSIDQQHARIADLRGSLTSWGWAVKDSFNTLQLVPQGFQPIFQARWLTLATPGPGEEKWGRVFRVETRQQLEVWERAWCGYTKQDQAVSPFRPVLVDDPDIAFLIVRHDSEVLGGLVANRGGGAVGVTNVFAGRDSSRPLGPCLARAAQLWPGLPIVAYEEDDKGQLLNRLGFRDFGTLRVWGFVDEHHDP
jgi:hypothetical protein